MPRQSLGTRLSCSSDFSRLSTARTTEVITTDSGIHPHRPLPEFLYAAVMATGELAPLNDTHIWLEESLFRPAISRGIGVFQCFSGPHIVVVESVEAHLFPIRIDFRPKSSGF